MSLCVGSIEKDDTNFITHFQAGKLYLYGIDEDDDVIDIEKAEKHLRLSARYAESEIEFSPEITSMAAEAYFHASIACYIQGNENHHKNNARKAKDYYNEAIKLAKKSVELNPSLYESNYHLSKYYSLLDNKKEALKNYRHAYIAFKKKILGLKDYTV
ncbi:hypothetical protein ES708_13591 [subsurface metagenome]